MDNFKTRTNYLIGKDNIKKLENAKIAVFGAGGVGGALIEALARSGIGEISIIDFDKIDVTNINRQIIAFNSNIGFYKVDVIKKILLDINENIKVNLFNIKIDEKTLYNYDLQKCLKESNYIIDAIDDINAKIEIIKFAYNNNLKIISALGAGNRLNPLDFSITTIEKTQYCPLARILRKRLKDIGIKNLKVVYSKEKPIKINKNNIETNKKIIGSIAFVPPVAGYIIASEVINEIIK